MAFELLGFNCVLLIEPDSSKLEEGWLNEFNPDLIIVDYGLGNGEKGDEVVEKIKKIEPYAVTIFYSGNVAECKENIEVEGVYFSDRRNLFEKIQKLRIFVKYCIITDVIVGQVQV